MLSQPLSETARTGRSAHCGNWSATNRAATAVVISALSMGDDHPRVDNAGATRFRGGSDAPDEPVRTK